VQGTAAAFGNVFTAPPLMLPLQVERGAFAASLRASPTVIALANHRGLPLASTSDGTLEIWEAPSGLAYRAELDDGEADAALMLQKIRRGLVTESSIGATMIEGEWVDSDHPLAWDGQVVAARVIDINRGDVTFCPFGANPQTSTAIAASQCPPAPDRHSIVARAKALVEVVRL